MAQNVQAQAKPIKIPGPDHPISVEPNSRRVVVSVAGRVVADTLEALTLYEAHYPAVQYIPPQGCRYGAAGSFRPHHLLPLQRGRRLLQHPGGRRALDRRGMDLRGALCGRRWHTRITLPSTQIESTRSRYGHDQPLGEKRPRHRGFLRDRASQRARPRRGESIGSGYVQTELITVPGIWLAHQTVSRSGRISAIPMTPPISMITPQIIKPTLKPSSGVAAVSMTLPIT
jgi:hypothetical protein